MASRSERQRARRLAAAEGRGGPRQGTPGTPYPNRSDMRSGQAPTAAPNQTYGVAGQQLASQQVVPISNAGNQLQSAAQQSISPAQLQAAQLAQGAQRAPNLDAPTSQPNTPLTDGIPQGAGRGPEALNLGNPYADADTDVEGFLRAVASQYPNSDVERLVAQLSQRRTRF